MHWVIICADDKPLADFETGAIVLLPSVREAANWMIPRDQRVERYDPAVHKRRPGDRGRSVQAGRSEDGH
jgi:hypothetical protein